MKRGRQPETTEVGANPPKKQQKTTSVGSNRSSSSTNVTTTEATQQKNLRVEDALAYLQQVKTTFLEDLFVYETFLDIMKDFKYQVLDTPGVIAKVSELFKGHNNLILGFNAFLPPGFQIEIPPEETPIVQTSNNVDFDAAISYVTKIKNRFSDHPDTYKTFLNVLHSYQKEQTTIRRVYEQVAVLFRDHSDLLEEFVLFLPENPNIPALSGGSGSVSGLTGTFTTLEQQQPVRRGTRNRKPAAIEQDYITSGSKKKGAKGKSILATTSKSGKSSLVDEEMEEDDYENRREFAQANIGKYGPSYRILPETIHQPTCSHRTKLCKQVLNDDLVSMAAGSEESSVHRKSIYDEVVFQCEDDRTELDIVIEQNLSTIRYLEQLVQKPDPAATDFKLDQLRDIHRASIARIYAEKANEVLEGLRKNPTAAVPIILSRLKQKDDEWKHARAGLNNFWREIYTKNYQKAMEEQCTNFKQMDKKLLNPKSILQNIDDRHVHNQELKLVMDDEQIHHIIFSLLEHVGELDEKDMEKVRLFWINVIVPFFNLAKMTTSGLLHSEDLPIHYLSNLIEKHQSEKQDDSPFAPILEKNLNKNTPNNVLFGNVPMVLFVRYYIHAYERLSKAKELAAKQMRNIHKPVVTADIIRQHDSLTSSEGFLSDPSKIATASADDTRDYFNLFLHNLTEYFSDSIDTSAFEEECKRLLGHQSWVVFTFDKLFANLQKQLQNINADESSSALIDAFKYESSRVNKFLDNSYLVQALKIVGTIPFYVFNFNCNKHRLSVDVVDSPEIDTAKVAAEERGLKYVQQFLSETNKDVETNAHIFLPRNKRRTENVDNDDLCVMNGLECKVCIATLKLFFVEDTCDLLYRKKTSVSVPPTYEKRTEKFHEFLAARLLEIE